MSVTRSLLRLDPPKDSVILVRTDNTVVVSLMNKQGSNKSKVLSRFLHDLLALCARNRWIIRSRHLPGHLNTGADSLSRSHPGRAEWSLSPQSFQQLTTHLSPEIDLFAHPGNAKLPTFGCPFPFPSATVVDALATNWNRWKKIYLFPPPDLIQTCLQKLENFGGSALVIVPVLPSAPWWPEFRLVCTPLDVDLDIGQWVQGEWLKAQEKLHYLIRAYQYLKNLYTLRLRGTRRTIPIDRPPRVHQGSVRALLEGIPAMANLQPYQTDLQRLSPPLPQLLGTGKKTKP